MDLGPFPRFPGLLRHVDLALHELAAIGILRRELIVGPAPKPQVADRRSQEVRSNVRPALVVLVAVLLLSISAGTWWWLHRKTIEPPHTMVYATAGHDALGCSLTGKCRRADAHAVAAGAGLVR